MTQTPPPAPIAPSSRGRGCAPWLIGCGATLAVVLVIGGAALWWFVGRPVMGVIQAVQDVERIETLDARVSNRATFAAPADGVLSAGQVERFLAVHGRIEADLAGRIGQLERRLDELDRRQLALTDMVLLAEAYTELFRLLVEAKEAQVAALNAEGFSLQEYAWVRREALRATGLGAAAPDFGTFVGGFTGTEPSVGPAQLPPVPEANRELIERYRSQFDEVAFLALIGL